MSGGRFDYQQYRLHDIAETIEEEIKKSVTYHRYQEAVLNRYESACRDLGISKEQSEWLLMLLMEEKKKADIEMKEKGIHI